MKKPEILPKILSSGFAERIKLKPGMTLQWSRKYGNPGDCTLMDDEWTPVTEDKSLSARYENTILFTMENRRCTYNNSWIVSNLNAALTTWSWERSGSF